MSSGRSGRSPDVDRDARTARLTRRSWWHVASSAVAVLTLFGVAPSASAHLRSGTVAVDYRARVFDSDTAAYSAQIFQSDRALGVTVRRGHIVVLVGYLGEPVFRLDTSGLWVNAASPTAVVDRLLKRSDRVLANTPRWRLVSGHRSVVWQDARVQGLAPGVRSGVWRVPLLVDGRRSRLQGELQRFPAPALWPWLAVLAVLLAGGAPLLLIRRRRERLRPAAVGFAAAAAVASIVVLISFAFDAYASAGTWIEAGDGLAAIAVGCWVMFRGPDQWRVAGAVGLGLVSLAVGLLEGAVFLHPIVLAVVPAVVVRVACVIAIGAGLDAAALGALYYTDVGLPTELGSVNPAALMSSSAQVLRSGRDRT